MELYIIEEYSDFGTTILGVKSFTSSIEAEEYCIQMSNPVNLFRGRDYPMQFGRIVCTRAEEFDARKWVDRLQSYIDESANPEEIHKAEIYDAMMSCEWED